MPDPALVRDRLDAGEGLLEIAADLGRSSGVLRRVLRTAGLPVPPWRPPRPLLDPAVLRAWYLEQGLSINAIASRSGSCRGTVTAALRAAGIPLRGRYERPAPPGRPVIGGDELTDLYLRRGLTARQIAAELGCEPSAVRAELQRHGITRPPGSAVLDVDRHTLTRLYADERLDDRVIAARYGVPTWRVTRRRRELNIRRDRVLPATRTTPPPPPTPDELRRLFADQGLPIRVIAEQYHTSPRLVRRWLTDAGYRLHPRGDRHHIPIPPADPVLAALATDPQVIALLRRHQIPWPPHGPGAGADRPVTGLTRPFLQQAHQHIGLSIDHITRLTGHTPDQVRQALHANRIRTHPDPGFSPWATRRGVSPPPSA